ncbi:hypothetical protein [Streptomyces cinereoruber]|uniref:hypothetical protein n=1 Tax=Streptomyces cinereoruber TaxID=67260 RepID=UPI00362DB56A
MEQGPYPHTVRIVDAFVSPDAPESPAPKDLTYVQLVLKADTPYWTRAWQLVPEGADLSRARLCEGGRAEDPDNCVPLGTVRRDGGQGPTAG